MRILYLVLKSTPQARHLFEELRHMGLNGTIVSADSLRVAVEEFPEESHFYNLRHFEKHEIIESVLCLFVLHDGEVEKAKQTIRAMTDNFKAVHGFMYSQPLNDYEGSF